LEAPVKSHKKIFVLLVDDHEALRASLRQILSLYADILPAAEVGNSREALLSCAEAQPDVVLMDMNMPDMDGIETARQMRSKYPKIGIILWAFSSSAESAALAPTSGANRILTKTISPDELVKHIREVSRLKRGPRVVGASHV
jgi:two-component system nitrate/nitrite response regulator NarL